MGYGLYNNKGSFRNAASDSTVSAAWLNTNWPITAKKISTNELEENSVKERFTNPTLPNQDIAFIQQKLQGERPKIIGILKRARYRRVEKAIDAEIARRAAGGQVGVIQGNVSVLDFGNNPLINPTIPKPQTSIWDSLFGTAPLPEPTAPTGTTGTGTPTTTTLLKPIAPTGAGATGTPTENPKSKKNLYIGLGIGAGVLVIGTVAYFALRKKK
jgi:hypothetical protein